MSDHNEDDVTLPAGSADVRVYSEEGREARKNGARRGGKKGGHRWTREEARAAGSKGGAAGKGKGGGFNSQTARAHGIKGTARRCKPERVSRILLLASAHKSDEEIAQDVGRTAAYVRAVIDLYYPIRVEMVDSPETDGQEDHKAQGA